MPNQPLPQPPSSVKVWLQLAAHPATVRRAFATAAIVGFVLIAINDGPAIIYGQLTRTRVVQMCLTVLVPYIVSTVSSISTRRELAAKQHARQVSLEILAGLMQKRA